MDAAISLSHVTKTYDGHRAVDDLSFDVPRGSIFGLLGRNGAGKTTTIRMIMDIIRPDTGAVRVLGEPMNGTTKDRIGYIPEERGLYPKMKVIEVLQFQGAIQGMTRADARTAALHWLERLELGDRAQRRVDELSKGMQQKVQFIAAVLHDPELLVLDEPFSGMDPVNQDVFRDLIGELNRAGRTIVFSTHVMASAEWLCRDIALIDGGRAVLAGPLGSIKERFGRNAVLLEYDGDGSFLADEEGVEAVEDYGQHVELKLREGYDAQRLLGAVHGRVQVRRFEVVRPSLHTIFVQQVGGDTANA